jgi:TolA-binding protein
MRALLGWILALGLVVTPALARTDGAGGNAAAGDRTAAAKNDATDAPATSTAPAASRSISAKPEASSLASELEELRDLLESQSRQLEMQGEQLKQQQQKMQMLEEQLKNTNAVRDASSGTSTSVQPAANTVSAIGGPAGVAASAAAVSPAVAASSSKPAASAVPAAIAQKTDQDQTESPLQLRIGSAYITPVGFMDFTGVWRQHDGGSGIGTNFASIPYGATSFQGNLGEFRFSMQNSRIGFRVDALVKGAHVMGYMESDFLGNNPGNVAVSSNSNTLRSRLYWVDVQKNKWEFLGGQTWSLITPGRTGISPLPGNLFYTQDIDVNYQLGLVWGRIPELRFVYHPSNKVAFAIALDSPEQYIGGSAGGPSVTFPANTTLATAYGSGGATSAELNNGATTLNVPNVAPDVILKLAFDPSTKAHIEIGGLERQFEVWNPVNNVRFSETGAGGFANLNFELVKGFRIVTNNFWSDGGGRYIFGQVPDVIVRANGDLTPIHAGSTVSGFEVTQKNTFLYAYYGALYVPREIALDANGKTLIGYGYPGAPTSQNRAVQEATVGFNQTFWKDNKYGALNFMGQYSYLTRDPWSIVPIGGPKNAHLSMVFLNLRYTLPGSAPTLGK